MFTLPRSDVDSRYKSPAIYALFHLGEIVYIGQSMAVHSRIANHLGTDKEFDSFSIYYLEDGEDIDRLEFELIIQHDPKYNNSAGNLRQARAMSINIAKGINPSISIRMIKKAIVKHGIKAMYFRGIAYYDQYELMGAMHVEGLMEGVV
jgi:hypothetical protein